MLSPPLHPKTSAHLMAQASPGVCTSSWLTASRSPATATWVPVAVPTGGMVRSLQDKGKGMEWQRDSCLQKMLGRWRQASQCWGELVSMPWNRNRGRPHTSTPRHHTHPPAEHEEAGAPLPRRRLCQQQHAVAVVGCHHLQAACRGMAAADACCTPASSS